MHSGFNEQRFLLTEQDVWGQLLELRYSGQLGLRYYLLAFCPQQALCSCLPPHTHKVAADIKARRREEANASSNLALYQLWKSFLRNQLPFISPWPKLGDLTINSIRGGWEVREHARSLGHQLPPKRGPMSQ